MYTTVIINKEFSAQLENSSLLLNKFLSYVSISIALFTLYYSHFT
jgi:hypothetical protein